MCTLVLAWQVFDGTPIAAAANRDEATDRPSRPPRVLDTDPTVVAPQDEAAGGTWIGYNDEGLFVAITNRRRVHGLAETPRRPSADEPRLDGDRSRGLLVRDALAQSNAVEASSFVRNELADREYAGFNLVVADAEEAGLLEWDGVLRTTHFDPGVHVVVNEGHRTAAPEARRIHDAIEPALGMTVEAWFDRAADVLGDHDLGVCVHGDGYGTCSSSLLEIDAGGSARYWFADGKPCETEYELVEIEDEESEAGRSRDGPDGGDGQI